MKLFQLYPKALAHLTCKSPEQRTVNRRGGRAAPEKDCQNGEPQITQILSRLGAGYRRQDCQIVLEITKDTVQARSDKPSTAKDTKVFG